MTDLTKASALALRSHEEGWRWGMRLLMESHPGGVFKHPSRLPPKVSSKRTSATELDNDDEANRLLVLGGLEEEEIV